VTLVFCVAHQLASIGETPRAVVCARPSQRCQVAAAHSISACSRPNGQPLARAHCSTARCPPTSNTPGWPPPAAPRHSPPLGSRWHAPSVARWPPSGSAVSSSHGQPGCWRDHAEQPGAHRKQPCIFSSHGQPCARSQLSSTSRPFLATRAYSPLEAKAARRRPPACTPTTAPSARLSSSPRAPRAPSSAALLRAACGSRARPPAQRLAPKHRSRARAARRGGRRASARASGSGARRSRCAAIVESSSGRLSTADSRSSLPLSLGA
jgi:hypothetical protein